jgi:tRNA modification GTPase
MARLLTELDDTIVALATPSGRAGISVIRLSGQQSIAIAQQLTKEIKIYPQRLSLVKTYNRKGFIIDELLLVIFKGPHSLTGEDVVEFQCHGSPFIVEDIIQECLFFGARLAKPGEFLQRSFLHGKYNLLEVEAIGLLIDSKTRQAAKSSLSLASGKIGSSLLKWKKTLADIRMLLESSLDFSEEGIGDYLINDAQKKIDTFCDELKIVILASKNMIKFNTGIDLCFIGPPNAGKSSLLNYFAQEEIAIVHEVAGTTRDPLKAEITIAGIPVTIVDTAGLRTTSCLVEQQGITKGQKHASYASVVVYLLPYGEKLSEEHLTFLKSLNALKILLINKIDLYNQEVYQKNHDFFDIELGVSVLKKQGIDELENFLKKRLLYEISDETPFVANMRQLDVIKDFLALIEKSRDNISQIEIAADLLSQANQTLGELTGEQSSEELLGQIFSTFCIGK